MHVNQPTVSLEIEFIINKYVSNSKNTIKRLS